MFRGREDAIEVGMRKCGGLSYLYVAHGRSEAEKCQSQHPWAVSRDLRPEQVLLRDMGIGFRETLI